MHEHIRRRSWGAAIVGIVVLLGSPSTARAQSPQSRDSTISQPTVHGTAPTIDRVDDLVTTAMRGALLQSTTARQRVATVTVLAWDPITNTMTFASPEGTSYTRQVSDTLDLGGGAGLKVGDRVDITWGEALQASPNVPPPDDLRHRLTFNVQWGVDNSFSGKMIKSATGQTTGGVPINLAETSFDDVYGRMGLFKVGVGYRISPRSEGVFNLVISRSGSETATIGTVSSAAVPLNVNFGAYNYWGFEGGQRFYFTRVRVTPYLGYLVGVNRFDDITGTFVNVPPTLTPGLAAQDGKFFEKSWALSFGPTGGVLVGVGPVEVVGEVQFRYMGGLSDVDWLVEEGLRDINAESSRWSFPFLIGARLRF